MNTAGCVDEKESRMQHSLRHPISLSKKVALMKRRFKNTGKEL